MNFGEQIKKIRKDRNLTQQEMADKLGISRQAVSNWENNKNLPDIEMLITMAQVFCLTLDELILGGKKMNNMTEKLIRDGSENRRIRMNLIGIKIGGALLALGIISLIIGLFVPFSAERYFGTAFTDLMICGVITFFMVGIKNIADIFGTRGNNKRNAKLMISGSLLVLVGILIYAASLITEMISSYIGFAGVAAGIALMIACVLMSRRGSMMEKLKQIRSTPLSISVYSVEKAPTKINDRGVLEIIFCLKGSVKFSYAYEEFTLNAGEYISVDKDAYYLYDGQDNICVSFYFDLTRYREKYPFICNNLFICEGFEESDMRYPTDEHRQLKGMLIALLKFVKDNGAEEQMSQAVERIVDMFVEKFDIFFFHAQDKLTDYSSDDLDRLHEINDYVHNHMKEKMTIGDIAKILNFTDSYTSEYIRRISIGFREMVNYVRANASEDYLLKTDKTILEISEECGFSDVKYYYSAFKRWYKCTPKQFRDQYGRISEEKITYRSLDDIGEILDRMLEEHYMEMFFTTQEALCKA